MKLWLLSFMIFFAADNGAADIPSPSYLYKIVTCKQWRESQGRSHLILTQDDEEFIHFSTEEQWPKVAAKHFKNQDYMVLKIESQKLPGRLVFEVNPGGTTKYYHLYDGWIPMNAVVEVTFKT